MNATRPTRIDSFVTRPRRRIQAVARRRRPAFNAPRVVLHILVGAITLVTVQALLSPILLSPLSHTWNELAGGPVVYAEQQRSQTPAISAPALSTTAASQASQQVPAH